MLNKKPPALPLLRQVKQNPATVESLFIEHGAFVLRTVRRLGASSTDAEDLTQQVFMVLHRRPELLAGGGAPRSLLFGISRRVVADYRKRTRRQSSKPPPDVPMPPDQESSVARSQLREALDRALSQLDPDKREVFVLYELEELSMPEVARLLGIPVQTAYTRLRAARKIVQRALQKWKASGNSQRVGPFRLTEQRQ